MNEINHWGREIGGVWKARRSDGEEMWAEVNTLVMIGLEVLSVKGTQC